MKILPIYQNALTVVYGAFMEGNLPAAVNYDMQTLLNNMVSGRAFLQSQAGGGQQNLIPNSTSYQTSPPPAWTTAQGFRGKRVLPKVTFAGYSASYQDLIANVTNYQYQLDMLFASILWHRCCSTTSAVQGPCAAPSATSSVMPVKTANADGSWTIAEYDFGAEVVVNSLGAFTQTAGTNNVLNTAVANAIWLQMQVGSTWTDVANVTANLTINTANSEKFYQLPATIQGRRFRLVSKAATNPFASTGYGVFALHFYGDYAAGTAPRTLGKIQHAVMMPVIYGSSWGSISIGMNINPVSFSRIFSHYGLTVTDDLKQSTNFDLLLNDATVVPGQEQSVGAFTVTYRPATLEVY
ncbi:hypothetical protein MPK71_gp083 [Erwinia phage pEa_SNUABM_1]|uniref:Uncharacterized protein n=1 Tax=Erwinia phage pEa_SNUABM_1 TaxID=2869543 RepID=A0AAE7XJC7_9CAUD|nr:hypothetical protein MPK71_gp083 [Erwinia phage pEa_SNUABM_1]QZE57292.1 hypothetical protein pEaSNUABM1_00083 [Erwinia phage pEa_SNUABM_1]